MRRAGEFQSAADHRTLQRGDDGHPTVLNAIEHAVPHLRMPQALGGVMLGQLRQIQARREMIADAMNYYRADPIGQMREAMLDGEHDAVVERVALGRTVQPHRQHRTGGLNPEQSGLVRGCGAGGVSHRPYVSC